MLDAAALPRMAYALLFSGVYLAMFLIRVAFGIVIITFGHYVPEDNFVLGLVVAAAPFLELITVFVASTFIDKYGRKGALLTGLGLGAFSLYGLALTRDVRLLALVNGLHGIAAALILVTTLAIIASYAPPDKRGREMGLFNFVNMFGWFAGFALGSILLGHVSDIRYTFVIAGGLATLGMIYGYYTIREPPRVVSVDHGSFATLTSLFRRPGIALLAAPWFLVFVFLSSINFFSRVTAGQDGLGFGAGSVAAWLLGVGGFFMLSQLVFGKLSDRYGRSPFMILGGLGFLGFMTTIAIGFFGAPAQADPRVVFDHIFEHGILLALFSFCALAFAPAALAALADEANANAEGTTMSVYSVVLNLGMILGPPAIGLADRAAGGRGVLLFFVGVAATILALVLVRTAYAKQREWRPRVTALLSNKSR